MSTGRATGSTGWIWLRIVAARTHQAVGWAGVLGLVMVLAAAAWFALAWQAHRQPLPQPEIAAAAAPVVAAQRAEAPLTLASRREVPALLKQIQKTVVSNGLAWAAADYKITAATESVPATLEVRSTLKGSYPQLRGVITQVLRGVPGLTIRELSMSRPTSETLEVEAKLTWVVFLQDDGPAASALAAKARP